MGFEFLEGRRLLTASPVPFTVVNNSPIAPSNISIALYGQEYSATNQAGAPYVYFDSTGTAHVTTPSETIPTFTLQSIDSGGNFVIDLPQDLLGTGTGVVSARMYFGMNTAGSTPLSVSTDVNGKVIAPTANDSYFDYIEFTLNGALAGNLNIDTSAIDQFGLPITLDTTPQDPNNPNGVGVEISRASVISQYEAFTSDTNDPFAQAVSTTDGTYGPYRISNPSDVLSAVAKPQSFLQTQGVVQGDVQTNATSITVATVAAFPSTYPFTIVVDAGTASAETMTVTSAGPTTPPSSNVVWNVTRTSPVFHAGGALVTVPDPAVSATQTSITVASSINFPTTFPFYMQLDTGANTEIVQATAEVANSGAVATYTVVRGQSGTAAVAHNENAPVIAGNVDSNPLNSYFDSAIDDLFQKYTGGAQLTLLGSDGNTYTGTVVGGGTAGAYALQFTSSDTSDTTDYDVYYPFMQDNALYYAGYTPKLTPGLAPAFEAAANVSSFSPSSMVFACNGVFADDAYRPSFDAAQQKVLGNLENQIVSALNRGVALLPGYIASTPTTGDWLDSTKYYVTGPGNNNTTVWNHYAQFFHQPSVSIDGKNYGFAFDDQQGHASDISVDNPTNVEITLSPWTSTPLVITGNVGDNIAITFQDATDFTVDINGTTTAYTTAQYSQVIYNGPTTGFSQVIFDDPTTTDDYSATQSLTSTDVIRQGGTNFEFDANNVQNYYAYVLDPSSTALINVAVGTGSNFFVNAATGGYSYIANPATGIYSELSGFSNQTATGANGTTYAYVYSSSHDSFTGDPAGSTFTAGGVTSTLSDFPQVYVVGAADGTDNVTLDSAGGTFVGTPNYSYVTGTANGSTFLLGAVYVANLAGQSAGSSDAAVFYSYAANAFTGAAGTSKLTGSTTNVSGSPVNFVSQVNGFLAVSVFESGSGTDTAALTSSGNGSFFGTSAASALTVGTSVITVNTYSISDGPTSPVAGQISVTGAHDGTDTATIYDAPGSNALAASGSTATLTNALGTRTINQFGSVTAIQHDGTDDTVNKGTIDFVLTTVGNWTSD